MMANPNRNSDLSAPLSDVASFSQNYTLDAYAAVPVVQANLLKDPVAHELRLASPYGGNQDAIDALEDKVYVRRDKDSQLCPVTRFGGVGVLTGLACRVCWCIR